MDELRDPEKKKRLDYERQHFNLMAKSERHFRKNWRKKKAQANREFRRATKHRLNPRLVDPTAGVADVNAVVQRKFKKQVIVPLKEKIVVKQRARYSRTSRRARMRALEKPSGDTV